nr:MAG TPA: hypothetical protein [Siphoviridae sp. ctvzh6]
MLNLYNPCLFLLFPSELNLHYNWYNHRSSF